MNSNPFKGLLYSRKFWLAVLGVAQSLILHYMDVPDEIWLSINGLLVTVIFGIAYEDGAAKGNPGSQTNLLTTGTTDVTVNTPTGAGVVSAVVPDAPEPVHAVENYYVDRVGG
jgi:hypothetical protein